MKKKIIKYFFEFLVIVISIMFSFWLNELSIENIENQERENVLANIHMEILDLKKYCSERSSTWNQDIDLYSTLLSEPLVIDRIKDITTSKSRIEYNLIYYRAFEPPMNRYLSIINSGDIKFIRSDKLKEILSRLHTYNYSSIETTVQYEKSIKEQLVHSLTENHPSIMIAGSDNQVSLEHFTKMLYDSIHSDPQLKSKLLVQMKYFETRKSLLQLYVFALEELESELTMIRDQS